MDDTTERLKREQAIQNIADHITAGMLTQKFLCDGLHNLAGDNHDGVWSSTILTGLDALRGIATVCHSQSADLWQYGSRDVPF